MKLLRVFLLLFSLINYAQNQQKETATRSTIKLTVEVYKDSARIIVPQDLDPKVNIRIPVEYGRFWHNIKVLLNVEYKSDYTNLTSLKLEIQTPHTTLVPVKIPPPTNNGSRNKLQKEREKVYDIGGRYYIEEDRVNVVRFSLKTCKEEDGSCYTPIPLPEENLVGFNTSNYVAYVTPNPDLAVIYPSFNYENENKLKLNFTVKNQSIRPSKGNTDIEIYASRDQYLDESDTLQTTLQMDKLSGLGSKKYTSNYTDFIAPYTNSNYVIINIKYNKETTTDGNPNNNQIFIQQHKDLEISDARIYKINTESSLYDLFYKNNFYALSTTITNKGHVVSPVSKINFYRESYPKQLIQSQIVPQLLPGESKIITINVTQQYYNIYLQNREVSFIVDQIIILKNWMKQMMKKELK